MSTVRTTFQLSGLHCESCKKITEKRMSKLPGFIEVNTNINTGVLTLISEQPISKEEVANMLVATDYQVL